MNWNLYKKKLGKENVFSYAVSNDNLSKLSLIFNIWFNKHYYKEIKKIVEENSIDLVHIHNFYPLLTPSVFKASKDGGAKVIHTLHNYRLWCISGMFSTGNFLNVFVWSIIIFLIREKRNLLENNLR